MTEPAEPAGAAPDDWATALAMAAGDGAEVGDASGVPVLDVPAERTLIVFEESPGDRWGIRGDLYSPA